MAARILIIEDNADQRDLMEMYLKSAGYAVQVAIDGEEGLKRAKEDPPDLILTDLVMPKLNGYEVCSLLKKEGDPYQKIPIIIVSAVRVQERDAQKAKECGATAYLLKTIGPKATLKAVEDVLAGKKVAWSEASHPGWL